MAIDFAFLVHPLRRWQRPILGVRLLHVPLFFSQDAGVDGVGLVGRVALETRAGWVEGAVIAVPDTAERLVAEQGRALALEERAAQIAVHAGARAIGLGNALGVVAARGRALGERVRVPVSNGHASTAWAASTIALEVLRARGTPKGPIGVLGFKGTVGEAIAATLCDRGVSVVVDATGRAAKTAAALGCTAVPLEEVPRACRVLVGANTTGPVLAPGLVQPDSVLVDLALPPTLHPGPRPARLRVVPGERLRLPGGIRRDLWGAVWWGMARYGRGSVFACFAEPILMLQGQGFGGRHLGIDEVVRAGEALSRLGFRAAP